MRRNLKIHKELKKNTFSYSNGCLRDHFTQTLGVLNREIGKTRNINNLYSNLFLAVIGNMSCIYRQLDLPRKRRT